MYSISAKVWLWLVALLILLSCSRESPEPLWEVQSLYGKDYKGGLFPVWIILKEPTKDASSISWNSRYARIAYRNQAINSKEQITADTAFLYWEEPPPVFIKLDSTQIKGDSTTSWKIDTTYYYRDTIHAYVDDLKSLPIIIEVKNILPRIKSVTVGGISQYGDSLLTIAAHPGASLEISLYLERPFKNAFNKAFHPTVDWPPLMGNPQLKQEKSNDSIFVYEWVVPNEEIADSSDLRIGDSGGRGERLYKVHLIAYTECGSVWVAAEKGLVKYSPTGTEVARISGNFSSISDIDISVDSKKGNLFVADRLGNTFSIYNTYGKLLYKNDSLFKLPTGIALDGVGDYIWVADANEALSSVFEARLRRFALIGDSLRFTSVSYEIPGQIKGLSINQFQSDFVWFVIPKSDTVGFTLKPSLSENIEPRYITNTWNQPFMVSHDLSKGTAWVADDSKVVAIDTSGGVLAQIKGFSSVSSVSASNDIVWVSDNKKVYRFKGPFIGRQQDLNLTVMDGMPVGGFILPVSVSAYAADGGAWVVDKGAGKVVRIDSEGKEIAFGTGLELPMLGKTLQKE
jgi:DNA-binding beta-propeller fold protein YncE